MGRLTAATLVSLRSSRFASFGFCARAPCFCQRISGHGEALDFSPEQAFDRRQLAQLLTAYERMRLSLCTGTARTANAMDVILWHLWEFEVDDVRQLVNVDAARCDVGCDQNLQLARLEF